MDVQPEECSAGPMWNQNVQWGSENSAISQTLGENQLKVEILTEVLVFLCLGYCFVLSYSPRKPLRMIRSEKLKIPGPWGVPFPATNIGQPFDSAEYNFS